MTPRTYRKKPVEITAVQWFRNGDHPDDGDPATEGQVVRYFRHPDIYGKAQHCDLPDTARPHCDTLMEDHGWIDTLEGGHTVCPGDWIITGVQGEQYPCRPDIFEATYEPVESTVSDTIRDPVAERLTEIEEYYEAGELRPAMVPDLLAFAREMVTQARSSTRMDGGTVLEAAVRHLGGEQ